MNLRQTQVNDAGKSLDKLHRIFKLQKSAFLEDPYPNAGQRIDRMRRVPAMVRRYRTKIHEALAQDFSGHSSQAADLFEILGMLEREKFNSNKIKQWMRPIKKQGNPVMLGKADVYIQYHPKGVVGNMVSWNFPFDIALGPMLDQLGAGNRVIIKPSDLAPQCGALLEEMIAEYYEEDMVAVVNGGLDLAQCFPTLAWDHLIYTGSGTVGRMVMQAAAQNLVPVTLELGGKSPAIVTPDSIDAQTARVIAGVKMIKRGQMCVTVDYCLVPQAQSKQFIDLITQYAQAHFAVDHGAGSACGIISERHQERLNNLLAEAQEKGAQLIQIGQPSEQRSRNMPLTLVLNPPEDSRLMREEIFGPILPIKTYSKLQDAIDYINSKDRPLGLYIFSQDKSTVERITLNTHSGGVCVNAIAAQAAQASMGFGGVGPSGMGRHHGEEGFKEFSYPKGYFVRSRNDLLDAIIPPFSSKTTHLIEKVAYAPLSQQLIFAIKQLPRILFGK